MAWLGSLMGVLRTVDRLLQAERLHGAMIDELADRQRRAEAREEILVAKAEAAAATAASAAASQHVAELARRLGNLEARVAQLERGPQPPRLPPPPE